VLGLSARQRGQSWAGPAQRQHSRRCWQARRWNARALGKAAPASRRFASFLSQRISGGRVSKGVSGSVCPRSLWSRPSELGSEPA